MSIEWSLVPNEFHYLRNQVLDQYGSDCRMAIFDKSLGRHVTVAQRLTAEEKQALAVVHDEICRRDDNFRIIDWVDSVPRESADKHLSAWILHGLLFLLADLAERKIEPFCQRPILIERPPPPLDWSTLPASLGFLKEAVGRYQDLDREGKIIKWRSSASDADICELEQLGNQIKANQTAIWKWQESQRGTQEEFCVHWLGMILHLSGIDYE